MNPDEFRNGAQLAPEGLTGQAADGLARALSGLTGPPYSPVLDVAVEHTPRDLRVRAKPRGPVSAAFVLKAVALAEEAGCAFSLDGGCFTYSKSSV